jgi:hypothetical protein
MFVVHIAGIRLLNQLEPAQPGIYDNAVVFEIQLHPPFLKGSDADDNFFAKAGNDQEFIGEQDIVDYEIEPDGFFDFDQAGGARCV